MFQYGDFENEINEKGIVKCIKTVYVTDGSKNQKKRIGFLEGKTYEYLASPYESRVYKDEEGNNHKIAGSYEGWLKDEWLLEHFEIIKREDVN